MAGLDQDRTPRMRTSELVRRTTIVTLTVLVIVGLALLLIEIRAILLWILVGVILAIGLYPAVDWLTRHRLNRIIAALLVSTLAIAGVVAIVVAIAWPVVLQADDFILELPDIVRSVFGPTGQLHFVETRLHVLDRITEITPGDVAAGLMGNQEAIVGVVTRAASFVAALITILVIMVMLLIQGPRAWHLILRALIKDERIWAERIGQNFLRAVGGYVRGNLAISAVAGVSRTSSSGSSGFRTPRPWPWRSPSSTSSRWWERSSERSS